jgi:hypothetical protein
LSDISTRTAVQLSQDVYRGCGVVRRYGLTVL